MNLSENKRVLALSAVFGLAFLGVMYYGFNLSGEAEQKRKELTKIDAAFKSYNNMEFLPSELNIGRLNKAATELQRETKAQANQMKKYSDYCVSVQPSKPNSIDFQNKLNSTISSIADLAAQGGVRLDNEAANLCMANFRTVPPQSQEVPALSFQLAVAEDLMTTLINSGAAEINKMLMFNGKDFEENSKSILQFQVAPIDFELSFAVKRETLPKIISELMRNEKFMYSITAFSAVAPTPPPVLDAYQEESTLVYEGEVAEEAAAEEAAAAPKVAPAIAVRKTGLDTETVRIHLNVRVLYFLNSSSK